MHFIVLEIQSNADGTVGTLVYSYNLRAEAESKYHTVLAAAAISSVLRHSAVLLTEDGIPITHQYYDHFEEQEESSEEDLTEGN